MSDKSSFSEMMEEDCESDIPTSTKVIYGSRKRKERDYELPDKDSESLRIYLKVPDNYQEIMKYIRMAKSPLLEESLPLLMATFNNYKYEDINSSTKKAEICVCIINFFNKIKEIILNNGDCTDNDIASDLFNIISKIFKSENPYIIWSIGNVIIRSIIFQSVVRLAVTILTEYKGRRFFDINEGNEKKTKTSKVAIQHKVTDNFTSVLLNFDLEASIRANICKDFPFMRPLFTDSREIGRVFSLMGITFIKETIPEDEEIEQAKQENDFYKDEFTKKSMDEMFKQLVISIKGKIKDGLGEYDWKITDMLRISMRMFFIKFFLMERTTRSNEKTPTFWSMSVEHSINKMGKIVSKFPEVYRTNLSSLLDGYKSRLIGHPNPFRFFKYDKVKFPERIIADMSKTFGNLISKDSKTYWINCRVTEILAKNMVFHSDFIIQSIVDSRKNIAIVKGDLRQSRHNRNTFDMLPMSADEPKRKK